MNKGRKITGGKYHANRKKKFYEKTSQERIVVLGEARKKTVRGKGGHERTVLTRANTVNLKTLKGMHVTQIENVLETPQNKFFARQNRLLKGVLIQTALGKAKITNRPSREGAINAVLLE